MIHYPQEERNKLYVARGLLDKKITIEEEVGLLHLKRSPVKRLKKGVREQGDAFAIHKNKGRKPVHALSHEVKERVVNLKRSEKYSPANLSHSRSY